MKIYSRRVGLMLPNGLRRESSIIALRPPRISCGRNTGTTEILGDERIKRNFPRPKDEHDRDSEKKKKLVRGDEFIWIAKNHPDTIKVSGAIRDSKQDE